MWKTHLTENDAVLAAAVVVSPELSAEILRPPEAVDLRRVEQVHPAAHAVPENLVKTVSATRGRPMLNCYTTFALRQPAAQISISLEPIRREEIQKKIKQGSYLEDSLYEVRILQYSMEGASLWWADTRRRSRSCP